jgi:2-C-methyl-D-erythritol 2,4-cyclodiphosphate synthase
LILGGVEIAHSHSLVAHSDGDVLLHALCDALLGAAGLGDIGRHFPDSDAAYQGIDSRKLLRAVMDKIEQQGLAVGNADLTIVAQVPKLAPHVELMCGNIAADLGVERGQVNVKATTTEQLGFTGRREGIAAFAVVLLEER